MNTPDDPQSEPSFRNIATGVGAIGGGGLAAFGSEVVIPKVIEALTGSEAHVPSFARLGFIAVVAASGAVWGRRKIGS